jgi:fructoselysine-6-P-deglycase FrlB-like protein
VRHVTEEIASQPRCWQRAAERAAEAAVRDRLPQPGERVALVGCGTALNIATVYAALREGTGRGECDVAVASEATFTRRYDRAVFISRSGTTTEVLDAVARVRGSVRTVALTARLDTPLAAAVDEVVPLEFADERSVVQTRFATSALVLLRVHLGHDPRPLIDGAARGLATPLPTGSRDCGHFVFVGRGWASGVAHEAALKLRESAQVWVESYPAMEYRHGPISVAGPGSLVWSMGPPPDGLAADVERTGARFVADDLDPLVDLLRAQRLAVALAEARGRDPDHPPHLTYSVMLGRMSTVPT